MKIKNKFEITGIWTFLIFFSLVLAALFDNLNESDFIIILIVSSFIAILNLELGDD